MDSPCIKQTVCKVFKIFQCGKYLVAYVLYIRFCKQTAFCKQTVETLIRRHVLRLLIWLCTVCLCPTKRTLGLYGLKCSTLEIKTAVSCHLVIKLTDAYSDLCHQSFTCLFVFVCFVALRPKSTDTVSSPNHTFSWASLNKQLTSTSCTYFRL